MSQKRLYSFGFPKESELMPVHIKKAVISFYFNEREKIRRLDKMAKTKVVKTKILPVGEFRGTVIENKIREAKGYEYHETIIDVRHEDETYTVKCGVPFNVSDKSALGRILIRFGADIEGSVGADIDTDDYIKGTVTFRTTQKGDFVNVNPETLNPVK